jgi:hypothetical protein
MLQVQAYSMNCGSVHIEEVTGASLLSELW